MVLTMQFQKYWHRRRLYKLHDDKKWKDGYVCTKCNHQDFYYISTRQLYECQHCHYQSSISAGTMMHKSKLSLTTWVWAIYLVAHDKRGKSALSLSQILDINYRTALRLLRKIRVATDIHKNLMMNKKIKLTKGAFIHSDQGGHVRQEVA